MSDDKAKTGQADRRRINVSEAYERHDWARKFNVSEERLVQAVQKVGPMASDVEKALKAS